MKLRSFIGNLAILAAVMFPAFSALASPERIDAKLSRDCFLVCTLAFDGEISAGDAQHIEQAIIASPHRVEMMYFNSPGGDTFEALKIADVLNKYFIAFATRQCDASGQKCMLQSRVLPNLSACASACALIFLTANNRYGTEVFFHRPTFSGEYMRSLSAPNAERMYNSAALRLRSELKKRGVSESFIESIMNIPSAAVQKLPPGFPSESPWLAEWLDAKCGNTSATEIDRIFENVNCKTKALQDQQRLAQRHD
jgi:hypothetical protein